jgi:hypothetical protein
MDGTSATSAIGLIGNAIQFVGFASKLCHMFLEIRRAPNGMTQSNADSQKRIGLFLASLPEFNTNLHTYSRALSGANRNSQLEAIMQRCKQIASHLIRQLEALQVKGRVGWWEAAVLTVKSFWKEDEILKLEDELRKYREELLWIIALSTR